MKLNMRRHETWMLSRVILCDARFTLKCTSRRQRGTRARVPHACCQRNPTFASNPEEYVCMYARSGTPWHISDLPPTNISQWTDMITACELQGPRAAGKCLTIASIAQLGVTSACPQLAQSFDGRMLNGVQVVARAPAALKVPLHLVRPVLGYLPPVTHACSRRM